MNSDIWPQLFCNFNTYSKRTVLFLLFLTRVVAVELDPNFQDLNEVDPVSVSTTETAESSASDDKATLLELQRKSDNMLLFRQGDEEIHKKFPNAIIRETENSKIKFFLAKNHETKRQIIVIRESDNLKNWIINFTFWKAKDFWTDIKLHKGFLTATREIFWDVVFHLEPEYPTEIYGHSLGGACSVILAMFLDEFGHPDVTVLSTGQPRVTDPQNARPFEHIPYERFTTARDLVTHLPPQFLNYKHFGKWFLLRKDHGGWMNDTTDPKDALDLWSQWMANSKRKEGDQDELEPKAAELWSEIGRAHV